MVPAKQVLVKREKYARIIWEQHQGLIRKLVYRSYRGLPEGLRTQIDAEDLFCSAMVHVVKVCHSYNGKYRMTTFLHTIVSNYLMTYRKKLSRCPNIETALTSEQLPIPTFGKFEYMVYSEKRVYRFLELASNELRDFLGKTYFAGEGSRGPLRDDRGTAAGRWAALEPEFKELVRYTGVTAQDFRNVRGATFYLPV